MTDADPAVHAAIRSTFLTTYPMHCTFHISQNLIKKLQKLLGKKFQEFSSKFYIVRNTLHKPFFESKWKDLINEYSEAQQYLNTLYNTKEAWAHPWTCRQFTAGLHASSPVESLNVWIKSYIFNSNISLCELADVIEKRQLSENRNHQLILWKAAIPCISTQISTSAFMFASIDKKLEEYLPPAILDLQKSEIYQCVFYDALQVNQEAINEFDQYNLLSDQCLEDIPDALCRHYFQIMLRTPITKFHLRLIPSRWYNKNKDPSREPFLVASKFEDENINIIPQSEIPFLTAIYQANPQDSITLHERLTDIQLYGKISGLAHKVTMKATRKKDIRIIHLLENYLKEEEQGESFVENVDNIEIEDCEIDKENQSPIIKNPSKQTKPKGRPKGTKRIKASHEKGKLFSSSLVINKQYKCSNCGDNGHNKRNCNRSMGIIIDFVQTGENSENSCK
ncbi:hypothetical protein Glove_67g10 [Diversispora epigaea]|uniref:CCHC-type domain-containing protein n=1 Tax=Diversispora epigaea TaxID=1348612 RepID=A0A397JJK1_9GLOM|nr:hypothetical protein Glove_67g10 [Diversispora epigaea]